jgi:hypothetical protein
MKAVLLLGPERIALGDVAGPDLAPGEVMIEPQVAGICGTDISFFAGHRVVPYPFILGHEVVGRVAALGEGVTKFQPGQRVIVEPNYPCGDCPLCRAGRGAVCADKKSMGVNVPGCFAAAALAEFVWALPDAISDQDAATIEPLVSLHGLLQSGARAGDTVAVLGCGVVGLLIHAAVKARSARSRRQIAEKWRWRAVLGLKPPDADDAGPLWQKENERFECAGFRDRRLALARPRGSQVILLGLASTPASFVPMAGAGGDQHSDVDDLHTPRTLNT